MEERRKHITGRRTKETGNEVIYMMTHGTNRRKQQWKDVQGHYFI